MEQKIDEALDEITPDVVPLKKGDCAEWQRDSRGKTSKQGKIVMEGSRNVVVFWRDSGTS